MPDYSELPLHLGARGWPAGLESFAQQTLELGYKISTDLHLRHAAWKGLLSYAHCERALVVERGCGSVALSLSANFDRVDAIYPDMFLVDAVRARFEHLGRRNISISSELAPAKRAYDAVAVCGLSTEEVTADVIDALGSALRPHGSMYLALETSRPRRLQNWAVTPIDRILKQLRRRFRHVQPFRYIGSILQPSELQPMGGARRTWKQHVSSCLARYRSGAIGIAVSNENAGPSLFEQIVGAVAPGLKIERYLFAHPIGFSLIALDRVRRRRLIVRMPMEESAVARAHVNFDVTAALRRNNLPFAVPVSVCRGEIHGQPFFAEQMLDGCALDRMELRNPRVYRRVARAGAVALTRLQREFAHAVEFTPAVIDRLVAPVLAAASEALAGQAGSHLLHGISTYVAASLAGRRLPLVPVHGDYTYDNVLLDRAKKAITGIFDWDLAERQGVPLIDLFYFLAAIDRARTNRTFPPIFSEALRTGFGALEQSLIADYCGALGISEDLQKVLFVFCWLHHVGLREYRAERYLYLKTYWTETMKAAAAIAACKPQEILA